MGKSKIGKVRKRGGSLQDYDIGRIQKAIGKALSASGIAADDLSRDLARQVEERLEERFRHGVPGVEDIQDEVEEALMSRGYPGVARAYILFRQKRSDVRRLKSRIGVRDDLKLGVNAVKVLERRYLQRDGEGRVIETPSDLFRRVARAVSRAETGFDTDQKETDWEQKFFDLMADLDFLPNSPTLMNAGTPLGQLSACFVLPVPDSIVGIFDALKEAALIHQSGGGTGFSFSRIRPKGDIVRSTMGVASGPVSFMGIFNLATGVMKQGGKRRGANMGILNADHPDIEDFALAKDNQGSFSNFNLSVGASDAFMEAAVNDGAWPLLNPRTGQEARSIRARQLLDLIVNNAWRTGDPGLVFLDEVNRHNPTPHLGLLEATNPCGELPLLPHESCNLGSINLEQMVSDGEIDWSKLKRVVWLAVRFLDDVIEANAFPLPEIEEVSKGNRKIGLGVMGFANALVKLGIPYDSEAGLEKAEQIMRFISEEAGDASAQLAEERGAFPNQPDSTHKGPGWPKRRNASLLSIAPTGTISIIAGCSSGIEPLFALVFTRNIMEGTALLEVNPLFEQTARERGFYSQELMERVARQGTLRGIDGVPGDVQRLFVTDFDIAPEWHVKMQAAFQKYTDNSVSKTVNLPGNATPEDIRQVYIQAYRSRCKGVTVYRYGSQKGQALYLGGHISETGEVIPYVTADSEYAGGCHHRACPT